MRIPGLSLDFHPLPGATPVALASVDRVEWNEVARVVHESARKLVALWGADNRDRDGTFCMYAAYAVDSGLALIALPIKPSSREEIPSYPELSGMFPVATRMQRAVYDLLGIVATDATDLRPWLRHGAWPDDAFPLRRDFDGVIFF